MMSFRDFFESLNSQPDDEYTNQTDESSEPEYDEQGIEIVSTDTVHITTGSFSAEMLPLSAMPGENVMEALTTPDPERVQKMWDLFLLALWEPGSAEKATSMTWGERGEAMQKWLESSAE